MSTRWTNLQLNLGLGDVLLATTACRDLLRLGHLRSNSLHRKGLASVPQKDVHEIVRRH